MTLTNQIITDAFRQSNLLALGVEPTDAQKTEALRYLNRLVKSVFGNEAGDPLTAFPIGRNGINRPAGYPWYDITPDNEWFVPENTRLMFNLDRKNVELYLHPAPNDGARLGVKDASRNISEYPIVLSGNGNYIEGEASITLDEDGYEAEWFYRADLANWMKSSPLEEDTIFPFPEEFDDFFISMLAVRLNPSYGASLDPQSQVILDRSRSQLRARYTQEETALPELALLRPPRVSQDRDVWGTTYSFYEPSSMFNKGWPF